MAIQKSVTLDSGIALASAYHKVVDIFIGRKLGKEHIKFAVQVFKDSAARDEEKSPVLSLECRVGNYYPDYDMDNFFAVGVLNTVNVNVIKQCYEWMKTQSNLEGIDYTENVTDV